jgi:hypothetical protein
MPGVVDGERLVEELDLPVLELERRAELGPVGNDALVPAEVSGEAAQVLARRDDLEALGEIRPQRGHSRRETDPLGDVPGISRRRIKNKFHG